LSQRSYIPTSHVSEYGFVLLVGVVRVTQGFHNGIGKPADGTSILNVRVVVEYEDEIQSVANNTELGYKLCLSISIFFYDSEKWN